MAKDIDVVEELTTSSISLRKIEKGDAEFFLECLKEKQVIKFLSLGPLRDLDHAKRLIKNYINYWDNYAQFNYIIELSNHDNHPNEFRIGSVSLWNISWLHRRASVGIWLRTKYWNQGMAKNALNAIKLVGFRHLKLHRLEAHVAIENKRSQSLFKSQGFTEEGRLKDYLNFRGTYHNAILYAAINPDKIA